MQITMIQTRLGESGTLLDADTTYEVSTAFGALMVGSGLATDTDGALGPPVNVITLTNGAGVIKAQNDGTQWTLTGPVKATGTITAQQATTAAAPAYTKGALYFDITLNKLRIGGATAWETITSV
jgi:hypothetical protein